MNRVKELIKKNNEREKVMLNENVQIYTNMIVYLRGSELSDYNQEVVREDIIALILEGQDRGDSIQKVMGENYKEICDEIIDAMPKKTKKEKNTRILPNSIQCFSSFRFNSFRGSSDRFFHGK